jgi:hypothetical protein
MKKQQGGRGGKKKSSSRQQAAGQQPAASSSEQRRGEAGEAGRFSACIWPKLANFYIIVLHILPEEVYFKFEMYPTLCNVRPF